MSADPHIWIRWESDADGGMYVVGDDAGEFARATNWQQAERYVLDLMVGPGTLDDGGLAERTARASA